MSDGVFKITTDMSNCLQVDKSGKILLNEEQYQRLLSDISTIIDSKIIYTIPSDGSWIINGHHLSNLHRGDCIVFDVTDNIL